VAIRFPVPDSAESASEDAVGGERVTLQEAAARLGVGITTARRWVRNGRLKAIQEETPQGHIWRVLLPAAAAEAAPRAPAAAESTDSTTDTGAIRELGRLEDHVTDLRLTVADLREQLARKDEELVARRREVQELHVLLGRAQLPKPVEVAATPDSESDSDGTPQGTPQSDSDRTTAESGVDFGPGRPWWKRLLFG
jgi:transposase